MLLGLAGKADDECGAEADAGNAGADAGDEIFDVLAGGLALHELEHVGMDVLEGHVHIAGDMGVAGDGGDEVVAPMRGVGVEETNPKLAADFADFIQKVDEGSPARGVHGLAWAGFFIPKIHAVVGGVLANEIDLLHAFGNEATNLAHDRIDGPAAMASAHLGNHTKAARVIAALGNFHIGRVVGSEAETGRGEIGNVAGLWRHEVEDAGFVLFEHAAEDRAGFGDLIESDEGVHLGEFADEVGGEALGKAAADDDFGIGALALVALAGGFQNGVDGFLFRGVDKSAGIHDEDIGLCGVGGDFEALGFCGAEHDLGVDEIFGATEADHANTACGGRRCGIGQGLHCWRFGRGEGSNGGRVNGV